VYDVSLAALGLQYPGSGYWCRPGFPPERITSLALHDGTNNLPDIRTLGRYSSEDRCGTQFNGSVLPVPSYRTCVFVLSSIKSLTKIRQLGFLVVSFASGIIASLPGLVNHPTGIPTLLAQNLPKSSTFFLT
jgi:hypothetical protein